MTVPRTWLRSCQTLPTSFSFLHRFTGEKQPKTKHPNTDLDVDYHGNGQSFEAFGSALSNIDLQTLR